MLIPHNLMSPRHHFLKVCFYVHHKLSWIDQSQTLSFVNICVRTRTQTLAHLRWKQEVSLLTTARSVRPRPVWSVHTPSRMCHWKTLNVRKLRLWVKRDGQMISIPSSREAIPDTMRNAQRNLLFHFQETVLLSSGHYLRHQMGRSRTNISTRGSALKILWQCWTLI